MTNDDIFTNRLRVAIIDDDPVDADLLQRSLNSIPDVNLTFCNLANVATPGEVVGELMRRHIDLVFVSIRLSAMTGFDVLKSTRAAGLILPLIMTGPRDNESLFREYLRAGADEFISHERYDPSSLRRAMQHAEARYLHRQTERELQFIQFSIDRSSEMVFWLDDSGHITNANEVACRSLGYSSAALFALPFGDITVSAIAKEWESLWKQSQQQRVVSFEDQLRRKDGSALPVDLNIHYVAFNNKTCLCAHAHDISERKKVQNILREKEEQLRQAQKLEAIGQLAGGLAHEFNNLLQIIAGLTEFAMNEIPADGPAYHDLSQVLTTSRRAACLAKQLLGFSRQHPLNLTAIYPQRLVDDFLKLLRPLLGTSIELLADMAEDIGPIHGDASLLQQVLMNLCVNARDAMPKGGELHVRVASFDNNSTFKTKYPDAKADQYVLLQVSDTGCGIPRDIQKRVFEPFFTTKEVGKGTGLGLAVVYGIVKQHNGIICLESDMNVGTTISIYIPVATNPNVVAEAGPDKSLAGGSETILVAEDDFLVRGITTRILARAGYHVLVAVDGVDAVKVFTERSHEIQLVMLDVSMPKVNGLDAYRCIQALKPNVPVIFSTGNDVVDANCDLQNGTARLLKKPFEPRQLVATVRETLDTGTAC